MIHHTINTTIREPRVKTDSESVRMGHGGVAAWRHVARGPWPRGGNEGTREGGLSARVVLVISARLARVVESWLVMAMLYATRGTDRENQG